MTDCLCSHPPHIGSKCPLRSCGCKSYRPRPPTGDEVEAWLAAREAAVEELEG